MAAGADPPADVSPVVAGADPPADVGRAAARVPSGQRAPRLRPDQRIAGHVTRRGRFASLDPSKGAPLPSGARFVAALAWLVLVEESLRRGWRAVRERPGSHGGPADSGSEASELSAAT